ncbi:glycosyltransferase [Pseudomonas fluorescens]|uniref:Glycosyltransferase 2-like domain-containing protein n=1 Tax=Pseudomonas fluorescens TaxID=294 RepID=A0A5E7D704_PSEFL|nr:glycosyltransferase family 2 protein [Pseudomonas fluorescens]VVO03242.1 hypothetical protein PS710_02838 [Pseudomonas fluorescens]
MIPELSAIIPTHNSSNYIKKTLLSVINSANDRTYEIIIIDDKSDDIVNLKKVAAEFKNIIIIEKPDKSNAAESRNIGMQLAKGEFIFLIDSDDEFKDTHINHRINSHKKNDSGIIFGNYITKSNEEEQPSNLPKYIDGDIRDYIFKLGGDVRSSTISIHRKKYKGATFDSNQNKHQDWGFLIRAFDKNENIQFDESHGVILDESANPRRMSIKLNAQASNYFLENYVTQSNHLKRFASSHLRLAIYLHDKESIIFIRGLYFSSIKNQSNSEKLKITALIVITFLSTPYISNRIITLWLKRWKS